MIEENRRLFALMMQAEPPGSSQGEVSRNAITVGTGVECTCIILLHERSSSLPKKLEGTVTTKCIFKAPIRGQKKSKERVLRVSGECLSEEKLR